MTIKEEVGNIFIEDTLFLRDERKLILKQERMLFGQC